MEKLSLGPMQLLKEDLIEKRKNLQFQIIMLPQSSSSREHQFSYEIIIKTKRLSICRMRMIYSDRDGIKPIDFKLPQTLIDKRARITIHPL
jgi:hypothetical protein